MKVLCLFALTVIIASNGASGKSLQIECHVPKLILENKDYEILLDKVLSLDKDCSYYTQTLEYGLWLIYCKDTLFITVEGGEQQGKPFRLKTIMGVLRYKKHNFYIFGDSLPSSILKRLKKEVRLIVPNEYDISEDDSHSIHYFCVYRSYCYYLRSVRRGLRKKGYEEL